MSHFCKKNRFYILIREGRDVILQFGKLEQILRGNKIRPG